MTPDDSSTHSARPRAGSGALPDTSYAKIPRKVMVPSPFSWHAVKQVRVRLLAAIAAVAA